MKLWEERIWRTSDHIVCVSDTDRQVIEQVAPGKVTVVPNGVDCSYFQFRARAIDPVRPKFLFVGNYRWFPNTEAVRMLLTRVWPQVRAAYPNAMLTVAGSHMTRDLKNLGEKQGARMRGWAEDIRTVYMDAHVFLAPLGIAGGSKFKILEAMACGCPVITTREGMTGLAVRDGEHVLKAQTPEDFTRSIRKLMEDSTNRTRLVHAARSLVERTYGWERIAAVLDEVWRNV
jgi:glycosyltransferase involved in cell wall biosynthesis